MSEIFDMRMHQLRHLVKGDYESLSDIDGYNELANYQALGKVLIDEWEKSGNDPQQSKRTPTG